MDFKQMVLNGDFDTEIITMETLIQYVNGTTKIERVMSILRDGADEELVVQYDKLLKKGIIKELIPHDATYRVATKEDDLDKVVALSNKGELMRIFDEVRIKETCAKTNLFLFIHIQNMLIKLGREIKEYETENDMLRREKQSWECKNSKLQQKIENLEICIVEKIEGEREIVRKVSEFNANITSLQDIVATKENEMKKLRDELDQKQKHIEKIEENYGLEKAEWQKRIYDLLEDYTKDIEENNRLSKELRKVQATDKCLICKFNHRHKRYDDDQLYKEVIKTVLKYDKQRGGRKKALEQLLNKKIVQNFLTGGTFKLSSTSQLLELYDIAVCLIGAQMGLDVKKAVKLKKTKKALGIE